MQPITTKQLRDRRAIVFCDNCLVKFDALELLSNEDNSLADFPDIAEMPWEQQPAISWPYWKHGVVAAALVLAIQIACFEIGNVIQNPAIRPALEKLSRFVNYPLPVYKNPDELSIMQSAFTPLADGNYAFKCVINNQAAFTQNYPNINLSLQDYTGQTFTHRTFHPQDYLSEPVVASKIAPDATIEISLTIAAPKTSVGGYNFEITY